MGHSWAKVQALRTITWEGQGNTSRELWVVPSRLCPGRSMLRTRLPYPRATSSQRPALCMVDIGRPSERTLPLNSFEMSVFVLWRCQPIAAAECSS